MGLRLKLGSWCSGWRSIRRQSKAKCLGQCKSHHPELRSLEIFKSSRSQARVRVRKHETFIRLRTRAETVPTSCTGIGTSALSSTIPQEVRCKCPNQPKEPWAFSLEALKHSISRLKQTEAQLAATVARLDEEQAERIRQGMERGLVKDCRTPKKPEKNEVEG